MNANLLMEYMIKKLQKKSVGDIESCVEGQV